MAAYLKGSAALRPCPLKAGAQNAFVPTELSQPRLNLPAAEVADANSS